ncbi:MAG: hypothetical protein KAT15_25115, partial [Bacteroidales bacterium]|nr:hypothetical protein [Bacteroidales bacterium]
MSVSFHGKRVMLGTGIKADFYSWDPELQRLKSGYPGSYVINTWLDTLAEAAEKTWKAMRNIQDTSAPEGFRKLFLEMKPRFSSGFFDVFYMFLESGA